MIRPLALLALLAAPVPALADVLSADPDRVAACHDAAPEGSTMPDCIGIAADNCQALAETASHAAIATCLMREADHWEALVQDHVARLSGGRAAGAVPTAAAFLKAFNNAQAAWSLYRDSQCDLVAQSYAGMAIAPVAAANCNLLETAARALTLRDLRAPGEGQ